MSAQSLGELGEKFVGEHYTTLNHQVILSDNKFDSEKDMTIDGFKVEVKTQVPFIMKDAFTIKLNQLKKCYRADVVYFVSVPTGVRKHYSDGKVYRITQGNFKVDVHTTKDGREMAIIPIKQLEEVFTLTPKQCKILQEHSISAWN